jgi:hypothetical protein
MHGYVIKDQISIANLACDPAPATSIGMQPCALHRTASHCQ